MNGLLEVIARLFADKVDDDAAVARIEKRFGHRAGPSGIHALVERVDINAHFLAIIRKFGMMQREEMANEMHVGVIVEADAESAEALGRVFFAELDEHRKFFAARLAPGGPEGDEERLAFVFGEEAIVAVEVD